MALEHPIFNEIQYGDLAAVQRRVLRSPGVLEQREPSRRRQTSLMYAIE